MYRIVALKNSYAEIPAREMFFDGDPQLMLPVVGIFWVLEGMGRLIAVDTGIGETQDSPQEMEGFHVDPGHDTRSLLQELGYKPDDFETVILTHLHWDHCQNIALFRKAEIVISEKEWQSVMQPRHPALASDPTFPSAVLRYLRNEAADRVRLVGDEAQIAPGIQMIWVGGHTPGSMAVAVETKIGRVVIASDTVFRFKNIEEDRPIGFYQSLPECYEGMARLRATADIVLPNHDPELFERWPEGRIG